ncbi:hypothetical protein ACJMK2_001382 [Sinanodonta woodiana]|uniref:Signal transducing adapter molecule 1 n=1 Tax=Sinanodonta woodiana TaxID=1069815 RepID=A0ABD3XS31_SINWO
MPLFTSTTPFDADVEKATSEMNTTENWALILEICDKVQRTTNGARDCLRSVIKRLNHKVPYVAMQALTLLDACISNCGREFHLEVCSRDFVSECRTLIGQKAHPKVAQRLRFLIKKWAEMTDFKDEPAMNILPSFYESLKKEGADFSDPDSSVKKTTTLSKDPNVVQTQQEEDDIAKAIALSLHEAEKSTSVKTTSLYPTALTSMPASSASSSKPKEVRKVRALYDFEAAEDNELTFKAGDFISVLDDSDANWWKGFNSRGEGLFPANFVTADLSVEPEEAHPKKVTFSDEVQVKVSVETSPEEVEIDESKIDKVLQMIQNADPTGEIHPDSTEMLQLEEQCKAMGPLIDAELEKIDRKHASLCELNQKVMDALQMYHNLMKETPLPYGYKNQMTFNPQMGMGIPQQSMMNQQPMYNGQQQYMMPAQGQGQMPSLNQGQGAMMPPPSIQQIPQQPQVQQMYSGSNQNFTNNLPGPTGYLPHIPQNPSQTAAPMSQNMLPQSTSHSIPVTSLPSDYGAYSMSLGGQQPMYQSQMQQQPLL